MAPPAEAAADKPPEARFAGPIDALAAQLDLALRAAGDVQLRAAQLWHTFALSCAELCEAGGRAYGGLLVDWHGRFLRR